MATKIKRLATCSKSNLIFYFVFGVFLLVLIRHSQNTIKKIVDSFRNCCCCFIHLTHGDLLITQIVKIQRNKTLQFGSKVIFTKN